MHILLHTTLSLDPTATHALSSSYDGASSLVVYSPLLATNAKKVHSTFDGFVGLFSISTTTAWSCYFWANPVNNPLSHRPLRRKKISTIFWKQWAWFLSNDTSAHFHGCSSDCRCCHDCWHDYLHDCFLFFQQHWSAKNRAEVFQRLYLLSVELPFVYWEVVKLGILFDVLRRCHWCRWCHCCCCCC